MGQHHGAPATAGRRYRGRLIAVLVTTSAVLVLQVAGGLLTGSLALLADAGHLLTDVLGLLLAVTAVTLAGRPATPRRTYGYHRLEILAAAANAGLLFAVCALILFEAWRRWAAPVAVDGAAMLAFAAVGLVANLVGLLLLRDGARHSLNVRGAYLEVLGDLLGSGAVVVAAAVIAVTGWDRVDPAASVLVTGLILPRAWTLLREATDVLLEAAPPGVDLDEVRAHILRKPGVVDVHDLHAWTITSGLPVMSAHVVVSDGALADGVGPLLDELGRCLGEHFDVAHSTFQVEPVGHVDHEPGLHA